MRAYIVRRLLAMIPLMIGVSIVIFVVMRVLPGDIAAVVASRGAEDPPTQAEIEVVREKLNLDRPLVVQYWDWVSDAVRLDFGKSLVTEDPVLPDLRRLLPVSIELGIMSMVIAWLIALPVGIISAVKQDTWIDYASRSFTIAGLAMPTFWVAVLLILLLSRQFNWLPPLGYVGFFDNPWKNLQQMIFPALALGWTLSATAARMTRSAMLEVLREDYITTARSKGLRESVVILRHALKNALIPVITIAGFQTGLVIGGTVLIEQIFTLPGMGRFFLNALTLRDLPVIQAIVLMITLAFAVINLIIDLLYGVLDPRIRYS